MTKKEYQKFKKEIKPFLKILNNIREHQFYSKSNTSEQWSNLVDLHYKWVKKNKGAKTCLGCRKVFLVCNDLNRLRND